MVPSTTQDGMVWPDRHPEACPQARVPKEHHQHSQGSRLLGSKTSAQRWPACSLQVRGGPTDARPSSATLTALTAPCQTLCTGSDGESVLHLLTKSHELHPEVTCTHIKLPLAWTQASRCRDLFSIMDLSSLLRAVRDVLRVLPASFSNPSP